MRTLLHFRYQECAQFLGELSDLQASYRVKSFSFDAKFTDWLDKLEAAFADQETSRQRAEIAQLRSKLTTAQEGINPETLTKVSTGRRAMLRGVHFRVLEETNRLLVDLFEGLHTKMSEARKLLDQILLTAMQDGVLPDDLLSKGITIEEAQQVWSLLQQHPGMVIACRKLKSQTTDQDIFLFIIDAIERMA
jgi:hypothetical protein